jgi:hypothetical protein
MLLIPVSAATGTRDVFTNRDVEAKQGPVKRATSLKRW